MRTTGAFFVALALLTAALMHTGQERRRIRELMQLCELLELLTQRLRLGPLTLAELFSDLSAEDPLGEMGFVHKLNRELTGLGDRCFSEIWRIAAEESLCELGEREYRLFLRVGDRLGNGDRDCQIRQLQLCSESLTKELTLARERFPQTRRLALGLSAALGAVIVIIFI